MKFVLALALALAAVTTSIAAENKCESEATQNALKCQKMRQFCSRMNVDSLPYELCMDDVFACMQEGKEAYEACIETLKNN